MRTVDDESRQSRRVAEFFSDFASTWDALYGGRRSALWRWFDHTFRRDIYERYQLTFKAFGENLTGKTILDIGCGSGLYCFEAARRGAALVVGLDAAEGMIAMCRRRSRELGLDDRAKFAVSQFPPTGTIPELRAKFDYAIVMGVMDYVVQPAVFLNALRGLISDFALVSFPGKEWLRWQIRRWRYRLLRRCAVYHYSEADVRACCEKSGFRAVEIRYLRHSGGCHFAKLYS